MTNLWVGRCALKAHSQEVSELAFVLLNSGPLGVGLDRNLGWKSRLNFSQKCKAGKWDAVRSPGPAFRKILQDPS